MYVSRREITRKKIWKCGMKKFQQENNKSKRKDEKNSGWGNSAFLLLLLNWDIFSFLTLFNIISWLSWILLLCQIKRPLLGLTNNVRFLLRLLQTHSFVCMFFFRFSLSLSATPGSVCMWLRATEWIRYTFFYHLHISYTFMNFTCRSIV